VAGLKGPTYLEKCAELGLETLEKRREDQYLALVYKFVTRKMGRPCLIGRAVREPGRQLEDMD
jgi:hypothetical protein